RHCKFHGVINFDARMAPDGSVELIECNPRFFFPIDLIMILGVNFVEVGISGLDQTQTLVVMHDKRLRLPKRLLIDLFSVRKFEPRDWQHIRHKLSDPLPGLMWFLGYQSKWSSKALDALLMRACRTQRLPRQVT